jgi:GTP pyrophosphokinase
MTHVALLEKAIAFATSKHAGQTRKVSGLPYITHPLSVGYLVANYKRSSRLVELLTACVLHDIIEDTDTTLDELAAQFSPFVASLVSELTSDEAQVKALGKNEYLKLKLRKVSSYALTIKLVDRLHNVMDAPKPSYVTDTVELMADLQANRKLTQTQSRIVADILAVCSR